MKLARQPRKRISRDEPVILFAIGSHTFAAPANQVDEIRDLHGLQSVAAATSRTSVSKVKSTLDRSGKTYFVVDASESFRQPASLPSRLMVLRGQPVAVLVDSIDRMAEVGQVLPLPKAFCGEERRWYRGLTLMNEKVVPVVQMSTFLTPAEHVIAKSIVSRLAKGVSA